MHALIEAARAKGADLLHIGNIRDIGGKQDQYVVLDPSIVVVGGGLASDAPLFLPAAERHLVTLLEAGDLRPVVELRPASFGAEAGAVGASILAREAA